MLEVMIWIGITASHSHLNFIRMSAFQEESPYEAKPIRSRLAEYEKASDNLLGVWFPGGIVSSVGLTKGPSLGYGLVRCLMLAIIGPILQGAQSLGLQCAAASHSCARGKLKRGNSCGYIDLFRWNTLTKTQ
ncbi:hypothetical protein AVEN_172809-1 [Araneus ventricosus]|uniref:Uncharacterized protein n=1 Tax=Araneus ventricosus TaxID=182803 RepID=A0A4Y2BL48_ARAVE|nr:hypothetical protein AVEN_172809-1 [Araneus ventricosus]